MAEGNSQHTERPLPDRAASKVDPGTKQRVAFVTGDRICSMCGFNLYGQPINRESHYNMLAVRCPECGTMAAIQEYPVLGKWGARWGRLIAAIWLITILVWVSIVGTTIADYCRDASFYAVEPVSRQVALSFSEYYRSHRSEFTSRLSEEYERQYGSPNDIREGSLGFFVDPQWWEQQADQTAIVAAAGTWRQRYDWGAIRGLLLNFIPMILLGCYWSILVPSKRWFATGLVSLILCGTAFAMVHYTHLSLLWLTAPWAATQIDYQLLVYSSGAYLTTGSIAEQCVGMPIRLVMCFILIIPLFIGMHFGRILVRAAVIALLPPKSRGWLAFLWTADGKDPPGKTWVDK
ncbi:MAG: hypothetical protein D8M59_10105 [Planctomycetes bacterium]|nr:hypothetical protein [Planctomycetota bacterium]NOG53389.1 hypothetical protein [Planctomycetota bacterium]